MWAEMLDNADIPHDYYITYSAFVFTWLSLIVPFPLAKASIDELAHALLPQSDADFII
jgi:hypothetical protein